MVFDLYLVSDHNLWFRILDLCWNGKEGEDSMNFLSVLRSGSISKVFVPQPSSIFGFWSGLIMDY